MKEILKLSIFAGIAISLGGTVFLNVGGVAGAVLFAFGLITVVYYKLKLYTGTAGFIKKGELKDLLLILLGNIIGCFFTAMTVKLCASDVVILSFDALSQTSQSTGNAITVAADGIVQKRLATGPVKCGILGIWCGMIMTTAVNFARKGQMLPLLFGVPLFILCGFTHCIADAFYYCAASWDAVSAQPLKLLITYLFTVLGNFAGCNLYRLFVKE
ncbi:MAG: formate/nitrite transporter family protein [Bacteroidaceae bacterium]|nr:formate/nitrite transporter family protein [Bacteroidaceae bacterium]